MNALAFIFELNFAKQIYKVKAFTAKRAFIFYICEAIKLARLILTRRTKPKKLL